MLKRPLIELNDPIYLKNENGFGCEANFSRWDKILYREPNVEIITNVIMSRPFKIQQGCLQGCPLSSLLFIQAIEPFAIVVQSHKKNITVVSISPERSNHFIC